MDKIDKVAESQDEEYDDIPLEMVSMEDVRSVSSLAITRTSR